MLLRFKDRAEERGKVLHPVLPPAFLLGLKESTASNAPPPPLLLGR